MSSSRHADRGAHALRRIGRAVEYGTLAAAGTVGIAVPSVLRMWQGGTTDTIGNVLLAVGGLLSLGAVTRRDILLQNIGLPLIVCVLVAYCFAQASLDRYPSVALVAAYAANLGVRWWSGMGLVTLYTRTLRRGKR
ncbi:hypothetical protein [Streptomyces sp. x-80]|jgi:hypothetical protein|uniref:hypothetical protein n=1 Tax=Streptomyces sp. x-80 TaxID=2789282 RepID=UPI003980992D